MKKEQDFGEKEMKTVGGIIVDLFKSDANSELKQKAKKIILELCATYPAPGIKIR